MGEVYRLETATGRKVLVREVLPSDPAGIFWPNNVFVTPDGKGYAYSIRRWLNDLFVGEGLK
jgi:hypothetical protein